MLVTGNMNPESRIAGWKIRKLVMKASCWVVEIVEMRRPSPRPDKR
jgi:hypothetical protein